MRIMNIMWFSLVLCVAVAIFVLKYEVQNLEDELISKQQEVEEHKQTIHVLKAEWTFLNDPTRLQRLGAKHLSLAPANPTHIISIDDLPKRWKKDSQTQSKDDGPGALR